MKRLVPTLLLTGAFDLKVTEVKTPMKNSRIVKTISSAEDKISSEEHVTRLLAVVAAMEQDKEK